MTLSPLTQVLSASESRRSWRASDLNLDDLRVHVVATPDLNVKSHGRLDAKSRVRSLVTDAPGFCIVQVDNASDLTDEALIQVSENLARTIGELHDQNGRGALTYRVEATEQANPNNFRFSKSNVDSTFHTDCAYRDDVPEIISLFCIRPAQSGGVSQISSAVYTLRQLAQLDYKQALVFEESYYVDRRGTEAPGTPPVGRYNLLHSHDGRVQLRYLRPYIQFGHERVNVPLTAEQLAAFDEFDRIASSRDAVVEYPLSRGECLIANNFWLLHNRTAFNDDVPAVGRLVMRHWMR